MAALEKLDKRTLALLIGGGALLIVAALFSLLVAPQLRNYRAALAAQAALPPPPADEAQLQALLAERSAQIDELAQRLHGDMAGLPPREIESFVVDRLQRLAWNHDVTLEGVRPSVGETIENFQEVLFRLELTGDYFDLFDWLRELRTELGFIVIKEYRMQRASGDEQSEPPLKVQVTVASYRREES